MFSYYHSTTSTPMSDVARNIFIIGKDNFSPSHCSIGTLIKSSYSTHNIFSIWIIWDYSLFSLFTYYYTEVTKHCQVKS